MRVLEEGVLDEVVRRLVDEFHPEEVILFGSHAWGSPDEDSDLDLLVIVATSRESIADRAIRACRSVRGIRTSMDIVVMTRAEAERYRPVRASLTRRILDEGRALYGRREALPVP